MRRQTQTVHPFRSFIYSFHTQQDCVLPVVELSSSERRDAFLRASVELSSSERRDAFLRASVSFSNLHNFN